MTGVTRNILASARAMATGLLGFALLAPLPAGAQEAVPEKDPESGFVIAEGWEVVKAQCTVCHSAKLVTQNHGTRHHWAYLIRWMQETQGLWQFPEPMQAQILDYLAEYYGPKDSYRRRPLPPEARPENPYKRAENVSG